VFEALNVFISSIAFTLSSGQLTKLREGGHVPLEDDLFPLE
jgi:hypothetical protein